MNDATLNVAVGAHFKAVARPCSDMVVVLGVAVMPLLVHVRAYPPSLAAKNPLSDWLDTLRLACLAAVAAVKLTCMEECMEERLFTRHVNVVLSWPSKA